MTTLNLEHSIDISHKQSLWHRQLCAVNITISECHNIVGEVAPGDFQVLDMEGDREEYPIPSIFLSFDSLHSTRCCDMFKQQLVHPRIHPTTKEYLGQAIVEHLMKLVSLCDEDDAYDLGFVVDARLSVEYFRKLDEEELAPYRLFDEMDDDIDDMDDDEAITWFKGGEEGEYNGEDEKEQVVTCSVCLEDLTSGMEFNRLPCSHIFHSGCIDPWLERNTNCPNCRTKLENVDGDVVTIATKLFRILNDG